MLVLFLPFSTNKGLVIWLCGLFGAVKGTGSNMIRDEMRVGSDDFALKESLVFTVFHQ